MADRITRAYVCPKCGFKILVSFYDIDFFDFRDVASMMDSNSTKESELCSSGKCSECGHIGFEYFKEIS